MKFSFPRPRLTAPPPRVLLGLTLIAISIAGTAWVIADNSTGTGIVLANQFIAAGDVIEADHVTTASVIGSTSVTPMDASVVVGRRAAVDIVEGSMISQHQLDTTISPRRVLAVPVGVTPATTVIAGSRAQLWFIPADSTTPPRIAATDVIVIAARRGSFGEGDILDISISTSEEDSLMTALGSDGTLVVSEGSDSM